MADDLQLAETVREALRLRDAMRADGASEKECAAAFEKSVRSAWPETRTWHYLCDDCDDTGWIYRTCTEQSPCGRPFRLPSGTNHTRYEDWTGRGRCSPGHSYVIPCFCEKGRGRQSQLFSTNMPKGDDAMTEIGKKKATIPSRFGR